jgi:hypothetical protein
MELLSKFAGVIKIEIFFLPKIRYVDALREVVPNLGHSTNQTPTFSSHHLPTTMLIVELEVTKIERT